MMTYSHLFLCSEARRLLAAQDRALPCSMSKSPPHDLLRVDWLCRYVVLFSVVLHFVSSELIHVYNVLNGMGLQLCQI